MHRPAYSTVARQEAERLGRADSVRFVDADFVSVASQLPVATLVTLDRVVCCYPSYEALLNPALRHAGKCFAVSYPRDVWYVRLGILLENAHRRLTKNPFRPAPNSCSCPTARDDRMQSTDGGRRTAIAWSDCSTGVSQIHFATIGVGRPALLTPERCC